MILQALKEYYDRKPELPREGWTKQSIPFLLVINKNGQFVGFEDTQEPDGKKLRAKEFLVPSLGEKKGNGIKSNLFWENIEYMLGIPVPTQTKQNPDPERVAEQHEKFKSRINALSGNNASLNAVRQFLANLDKAQIKKHAKWPEVFNLNQPILIAIQNQFPVTDDPDLRQLIDLNLSSLSTGKGRCLITGEEDKIVSLEPPIRGVLGANPTGACLVGFQKHSGYDSFGKEQGMNAPIGKSASFAYTTALNHLLRKDSTQKLTMIGDMTTVFWSAKEDPFETQFCDFFTEPPKDDPDRLSNAVKSLYRSVETGAFAPNYDENKFYILSLAPNAARIAVRFWVVDTIKGLSGKIRQHFEDLKIVHGLSEPSMLSLWRLLVSTAPPSKTNKSENIPPNLAGDTMRTILEGLPYPQTLLQAVLRRIKAEHDISYPRAALIKACLNRSLRFHNPAKERELTVSLDPDNTNIGYRLGRLFATLEKIQEDAAPGINATIRDRFYGAASGTPATVFGTLMRMKIHHLGKLQDGLRIARERQIGEIMSGIQNFPAHLALADQGRFAIGYYHQRQEFFTKKSDK